MNVEELSQVATVKDLQKFQESILDGVKVLLYDKHTLGKEFFSPKEFSHLSGIKYSTVVYRCKVGKLKARQDDPNCSWQIDVCELERFKNEAHTNTL